MKPRRARIPPKSDAIKVGIPSPVFGKVAVLPSLFLTEIVLSELTVAPIELAETVAVLPSELAITTFPSTVPTIS